MRRRQFITLLGGAVAAWPLAARAQEVGKKYTIGIFSAGSQFIAGVGPIQNTAFYVAFLDALRDLGWVEGKNILVERRYAENQLERLPVLAAELVRLNVDVIVGGGTLAPLAAKRATSSLAAFSRCSGTRGSALDVGERPQRHIRRAAHDYGTTREQAMSEFAKSWRQG